ncbi:molybdopterin molybdenumtransferase MoeA [Paramagnetospirillum kuznetsovii]|uniref:Molybdopterin molybdenumtransferase n=1 Tax=Paramagnetospirillum kuznetsovii TaxID=2053833 RepID=A0A364NZ75_9PROT|nr:gephyrin-like molybdotransferase Glp [Paramagnetospirillum kuznetsovii]RAU22310.1 molybdopterin molybdenumtransferase MoeA [Paramagnetospirillum kuznetsovii]
MISVDEARATVLAGVKPVAAETVGLAQAAGRVLAQPLAARVSHPPVPVSSMDGYALRAADLAAPPTRLSVIGESAAGSPFDGVVGQGQTARIFTGAALPAGADAVVMQEDCERDGQSVTIKTQVPAGKFIRPVGLDFKTGDVLLEAGAVLDGRAIGLAAAMNIPWVSVRRRPRIAILSTGDEIAMPGEPLGPSQILGSNGPGLAAFVGMEGAEAVHLGIARDSRESLDSMIAAAAGCDLLVTTGGASVGDYDLVKDALAAAGLALNFYTVAMRPGKPLMFGDLKGVPVLGLPGNPVSVMVCAVLLVRPMIRTMLGLPSHTETVAVRLGRDLPANDIRQDYLRSSLASADDGAQVAIPFEKQDSAVLSGMVRAACLVIRPPFAPAAKAGDMARAIPL